MARDDNSSDEGKVTPAKGKSTLRKKRRNKPKDYPKRPLSAYNVFFKETREQILASKEKKEGEKRDHKLDFQTMAKEIATRWKALDKEERGRVEKLAKKDMFRYRDEVKIYEEEMVKKNREQREEAAANTKKEQEEAAVAASAEKTRLAERAEKEEAIRKSSAGNGATAPASLDMLSALAAGRFQSDAGSNEAALQEALMLHQQREMIQSQLLLEELRAVEEREFQLRRLHSLGLIQGDNGLGGLQAHQLSALLGGYGGQNPGAAALLQDHSGRGGGGLTALGNLLGGGHHFLGGAGGFSPELLLGSSAGSLQDAYLLQQHGLLQDHYARLLGTHKDAGSS